MGLVVWSMVIARNTSVAPSFYETVGSVPHKLKAGPDCGFKFMFYATAPIPPQPED